MSINLSHAGYELHYSMNLTNPSVFDNLHHKKQIDILKWFIVSLPKYSGRVYRKDHPQEKIWSESDVYFTYYKGRGRINKGDRMVCFYEKEREVDLKNCDFSNGFDENDSLY